MLLRVTLLLLLSATVPVLCAAPLAAQESAEAPDPSRPGLSLRERLDTLVERVRLEQARVETMESPFVQNKESELFLEPETATGVFSYRAPDRIRWQYRSPDPIVMLIDDEEMMTWYQDLGRAEIVSIKNYAQRVFKYLGAGGSLDTLTKYFWLTATFPEDPADPYHLQLKPRYRRVEKRLRGLEIWIDRELFLPIRLRYVEPNGDVTEYRFEDLRVNVDLPPDRFEVELPSDVEIDRLGSAQDSP